MLNNNYLSLVQNKISLETKATPFPFPARICTQFNSNLTNLSQLYPNNDE